MRRSQQKILALAIGLALVGTTATSLHLARAQELLPETLPSDSKPVTKNKFEYKPLDRDYWARVDKLISSGKPAEVFKIDTNVSGPELEERRLGVARALVATGHPIHAQYLLSRVAAQAVGTRQGFEALRMIHEIAHAGPVDEIYLEELSFDLDTKVDEPDSRSMVGYFKARSLLRKGYAEWANQAMGEIANPSTWSEEVQYDRTLQILNSGDSATAYSRFETISVNPAARRSTALLSKLALARLVFERKDYKASIATYRTIDLPTREKARSLNELAWSYYYERAYGRALGVIRALKSRYFRQLLSPESLLLEMLIHRELCHYKKVKESAADFTASFSSVYRAIENRRPLEALPQFVQMGLQEGVLQRRATSIQQVRMERRSLVKQPFKNDDWLRELLKLGDRREKIADAEINRMLLARVDQIANWFLDLREQVWFLEYESSIRMIQLNDDLSEQYESPKASKSAPETLFWPVSDEAWLDELLDYEVLVQDTCKGSPAVPAVNRPGGRGR